MGDRSFTHRTLKKVRLATPFPICWVLTSDVAVGATDRRKQEPPLPGSCIPLKNFGNGLASQNYSSPFQGKRCSGPDCHHQKQGKRWLHQLARHALPHPSLKKLLSRSISTIQPPKRRVPRLPLETWEERGRFMDSEEGGHEGSPSQSTQGHPPPACQMSPPHCLMGQAS